MATKNYSSVSKGENGKSFGINNLSDQYSNLNLNKSHKCSSWNSGHTKIISKNEEKKKLSNHACWGVFDLRRSAASTEKGSDLTDSQNSKTSWKKSDTKFCNYFELDSDEIEKDKKQNDKNSSSSDKNSSTLSLHIAAYENFIETKNEKSGDGKDGLKDLQKHEKSCLDMQILCSKTSPDMMNPFEFPRQQEDKKYPESEISQFQASQRLFTPNQSISSTQNRPNRVNPISNVRSVRPPPPSNRPSLLNQGNSPRLVNQFLSNDINLDSGSLANWNSLLDSNNVTNLQLLANIISNQLRGHQLQSSPQTSTLSLPPALGGHSTLEPVQQQMVQQFVPEFQQKIRAMMNVAENIVQEDQFNAETFGDDLNERCINAGMQGTKFIITWNRFKTAVKTRWQKNDYQFENEDDRKFAGIQRRLDASYCMPQRSSTPDSFHSSSMETQNSTRGQNSVNRGRGRPKSSSDSSIMAQHHQKRVEKIRAMMDVAEEIVGEANFEPKTFGSQLNKRCINAGIDGTNFASSWYHYAEYAQKQWERNDYKFANSDDERLAAIHRHLDNSFCMPGDQQAENSFNHAFSDVENYSSNSNVDESSQTNSFRRTTRRGRKRTIRSLSPGFGSPLQSAASGAENGSYVRGSFNFPSIPPSLPMPNNLTVDEHSFAKKAATKSKMASSNDEKTNPFQSEVEVDENVTIPSENQNSENLQPSDSVTVEPNVTITAAEIAETPSEITVGLSPFFSAPLSTSPSNISSSLASEARQQQSQQFAANLQVQSPAQMHEQTQQLQQIYHSGQSDLFAIISNQIRTMENQTNSMAKLMEKQLDAFKTNSK